MPCQLCAQRDARPDSLTCGACHAYLRATLHAVAWAHSWLYTRMIAMPPVWKPATTRSTRTEPPTPFAVQLHDVRTAIHQSLNWWASRIAYLHQPIVRGPADHTVPTVARWLTTHLGWATAQPRTTEFDVADLYEQLDQLHRDAYAIAPWESCRRDLPLPCPECEQLTLSVYGGDDAVICRDPNCARVVGWADYQDAVRTWSSMITRRAA